MKKLFKNEHLHNLLYVCTATSLVLSSFANMSSIVILAMLIGLIGGMIFTRFTLKKEWRKLFVEVECSKYVVYALMFVASLIGSQISWAALLV